VFIRILIAVQSVDSYFQQREDCTGLLGLSALQKVVAAMRILAYGLPLDAVDEYVQIGTSTAREALNHFCSAVITAFGEEYLRSPTLVDVARLLQEGERRGFSGMLGSIDCMHWEWRNCPTAWKGMFIGRGKHPSMILEAVASHDLWIWHAYFGLPGSCNDIMNCRGRLFSQHIFEESHLLFTSLSTDGHMTLGTTMQMVYTLIGQHLSRVFAILWRGRHNVLLLCFSIVIRSLGHDYLLRFGTALDVICSTGILKHTQNQVLD